MLLTVVTHEGSKETLFRALLTHPGQSTCSQNSARSPLEGREKLVFVEQLLLPGAGASQMSSYVSTHMSAHMSAQVISCVSSHVISHASSHVFSEDPTKGCTNIPSVLLMFLQQNWSQMETL